MTIRSDDVQEFDTRWDELPSGLSKGIGRPTLLSTCGSRMTQNLASMIGLLKIVNELKKPYKLHEHKVST